MDEVNVLIGSGGRRNYLVNWFREALENLGVRGSVSVIDATASAPALADADRFAVVPPITSEEYFPTLSSLCQTWGVGLAFSVNDFEGTLWAASPASPFAELGITLIAPSAMCQSLVEDKAAYPRAFASSGVRTPATLLGSEALRVEALPWSGDVIIKHRYGSGSAGLARVSNDDWIEQLRRTAASAKDRVGQPVTSMETGLEYVVAQEAIDGVEYGLDVVHDFQGQYVAALARRKLRMRSGETDQATTVDATPFKTIATQLGGVTQHRGLIDTDVIVDSTGVPHLIDVNPRFGGGYPFTHVAGARIPDAYLGWHLGRTVPADKFIYETGVTSAKTEDIRVARSTKESVWGEVS